MDIVGVSRTEIPLARALPKEQKRQQKYPNLIAGNPGNHGGRPSKFDPKYCQEVIDHMARGFSLESFAGKIDVSRDTIFDWRSKFTEFSDAVDAGYAKSLLFFETLGIQGIAGKIKNFNNGTYALTMANKHKWKSGRTDITTNDEKLEPSIIYLPREEGENAKE